MTIDLNTCQPGQQLICRDGLKAKYLIRKERNCGPYPHLVEVFYRAGLSQVLTHRDSGLHCVGETNADIIEILPIPTPTAEDHKWSVKISDDRVEANSGFWAVYQGEA